MENSPYLAAVKVVEDQLEEWFRLGYDLGTKDYSNRTSSDLELMSFANEQHKRWFARGYIYAFAASVIELKIKQLSNELLNEEAEDE